MLGLMQSQPLLIASILRHAARHHGGGEVVWREPAGDFARIGYAALERRAQRLARALLALGVRRGDRVATLAWNSLRHLELCYAVSGFGAVFHPLNPRLPPEQLGYIAGHAGDSILFADPAFAELLQTLAPLLPDTLRAVVVMTDASDMPDLALPSGMRLLCYDALMHSAEPDFDWPRFDENTASGLCYTSGTTGLPKGVLFSHRSTVLHATALNAANVLGLCATDRVLSAVQLFHVNAVGLPFAAPMAGASLLLAGRWLDGASLAMMLNAERATVGWAVPTIWLNLLRHLDATGQRLTTLRRAQVGGSACPRELAERLQSEHGVLVQQSWGMTEASPLATYNRPTAAHAGLDDAARLALGLKQGRSLFGVDLKLADEQGCELPWDGTAAGRLFIRGPWVIARYYGASVDAIAPDGWFDTGDVATIDPDGFVAIVDRAKDMIKSGGEWISSLALEAVGRTHPEVADVAAIAVPHPLWMERPLLVVVARPGCACDPLRLRDWFRGKVSDWALPDAAVLVDALPLTGTGKVDKRALRARFSGMTDP